MILTAVACHQKSKEAGTAPGTREAANETEQNIYRCGDSMLAAFKRKDWVSFVKYNHPNMTKRMGGTEAYASFINMQMKQIPDSTIQYIRLGKILQIVKTPKDEQCVVEQNMQMHIQRTTIDKTTYLIGESLDNGKNWTFLDASANSALPVNEIKPDISKDLKIPEKKNETKK